MLPHLDQQLCFLARAAEMPDLPEAVWERLASVMFEEIAALDDATSNQLRVAMLIPPERYIEELGAFQEWMELAHRNRENPVVVRVQVMTQLYVSFVWLRDSLLKPASEVVADDSVFAIVERFLNTGARRRLRNAIAHGRWCYTDSFDGLECWSEPSRGRPHERFEVTGDDLHAWQMLARATAITALLALTEQ